MAVDQPLATLVELEDRLDWDLSPSEKSDATEAIEYASALVRHFGRPWADPATAPRMARSIVLAAAKRYMNNPDGYTTSRAGDETLSWDGIGENAGTVYLTKPEMRMLRTLGGGNTLTSVPVMAWSSAPARPAGTVPVEGGGKDIPLFADDDPFQGET